MWRKRLQTDGWAYFDAPNACSLEIASALGKIVPAMREGGLVQSLRPKPATLASSWSLSSVYGLSTFPFHTDAAHHPMPPHYIVMRLVETQKSNCATLILPLSKSNLEASEFATLRRDVWIVNGGRGKFTTTVVNTLTDSVEEIVRFDLACMRPCRPNFSSSLRIMLSYLQRSVPIRIPWVKNHLLVLDNWRMLHGREAAVAGESRTLERVLIS